MASMTGPMIRKARTQTTDKESDRPGGNFLQSDDGQVGNLEETVAYGPESDDVMSRLKIDVETDNAN